MSHSTQILVLTDTGDPVGFTEGLDNLEMVDLLLGITHNGQDTFIAETPSNVDTNWKEAPGRKHWLYDLVLNFSQSTMQQQEDVGPDGLLNRHSSVVK